MFIDEPEETHWTLTNSAGAEYSGTDATWDRASGEITLGGITLIVVEPVFVQGLFCRLRVGSMVVVAPPFTYQLADPVVLSDNHLFVNYLSDRAISATALGLSLEAEEEVNGETIVHTLRVDLQFDINTKCSNEVAPETGRYTIKISGATLESNVTRWDRNIQLVVLGPNEDGGNSDPEHGMNLTILEPVRAEADSCVIKLAQAQLTIANKRVDPDTVKFYQFPPSTGVEAELTVDVLNDVVVSAKGRFQMLRLDAFGAHETVWVDVDFDAFEPGYVPPTSKR